MIATPSKRAPVRLTHLPLALFAAPMGIGGTGLAWRAAVSVLGVPALIGEILLGLTILVWVLVAGLHLVRVVRTPLALMADLAHPVRSAFAGAVTIGLMIISGGLFPYAPTFATGIWLGAIVLHLAIGVWTVRGLLTRPREIAALTPPLLIPLVGNIIAPVFGVQMGYENLCWVLFGVGGLLWAMIQPLILARIVTGPALPEALKPTLGIFLAPSAAGTIALAQLTHGFGPGPLILLGLAGFIVAVLATLTPNFARVPFAMSWWGWTFPTGAFATAIVMLAKAHPDLWLLAFAWITLIAASAILILVSLGTLRAAWNGKLLQKEGAAK